MSHDALYNMHELHSQLVEVDRNGATKSFIMHLMSIPRIVVHLLPHTLLQSLETLLKVESLPVTLHYDTVFNVGDFYLSTLTYGIVFLKASPLFLVGICYTREDYKLIINYFFKQSQRKFHNC